MPLLETFFSFEEGVFNGAMLILRALLARYSRTIISYLLAVLILSIVSC